MAVRSRACNGGGSPRHRRHATQAWRDARRHTSKRLAVSCHISSGTGIPRKQNFMSPTMRVPRESLRKDSRRCGSHVVPTNRCFKLKSGARGGHGSSKSAGRSMKIANTEGRWKPLYPKGNSDSWCAGAPVLRLLPQQRGERPRVVQAAVATAHCARAGSAPPRHPEGTSCYQPWSGLQPQVTLGQVDPKDDKTPCRTCE